MSFMNGVLADDVQDLAKEVPCRENEEARGASREHAGREGESGRQNDGRHGDQILIKKSQTVQKRYRKGTPGTPKKYRNKGP